MRPVVEAFLEAAATITDSAPEISQMDSSITDFGIDSIALLEIAMILEDEYGVEIDLEDFRELPTLRAAVEAFESLIGQS
jgi:acyl carrier protein